MHTRSTLGLPERGQARVYATERFRDKARGSRPKKEGHDALIAALANRGATIYILLISGNELVGTLKESDRFTITVLEDDGEGGSRQRLVYKHAVESFTLDTSNVGTRNEI